MLKKILITCGALLALLCIVGVIIFFNLNQILLNEMKEELLEEVKEECRLELIEERSVYGKLNGNGNGVQYFGAVLVRTKDEDTVAQLVQELSDEYEIVGYLKQENAEINVKYLENKKMKFSSSVDYSENDCYSIYFYNSYHAKSNIFDLNAH